MMLMFVFSRALFSSTSFLPAGSVQKKKTQDNEALQTGNVWCIPSLLFSLLVPHFWFASLPLFGRRLRLRESCLRYKHWLSAPELQVQYKIDFPFSHHGKVHFSQKKAYQTTQFIMRSMRCVYKLSFTKTLWKTIQMDQMLLYSISASW